MRTNPTSQPPRRPETAIQPIRQRLARLEAELDRALLAGTSTAATRGHIDAATRELGEAERRLEEEAEKCRVAVLEATAADDAEAEEAWRVELAEFIGTLPPIPKTHEGQLS